MVVTLRMQNLNNAGRAGKAYKDREGYIIISYANSQQETRENVKRYIKADLEELFHL